MNKQSNFVGCSCDENDLHPMVVEEIVDVVRETTPIGTKFFIFIDKNKHLYWNLSRFPKDISNLKFLMEATA